MPPAAATAAHPAQSHAVAAEEQPPLAAPPPTPTPTAAEVDDAVDDAAAEAAAEVAAENAALWLELTDIDEVLVNICRFLGLRELGRLACVARRYPEPTLTEPGGAKLLSPIEEGARLRLAASAVAGGGGSGGGGASGGAAAERWVDETWVRALWRVQCPLKFTSCGPEVVLSEEGALRLRAAERGRRLRHSAWGARAWAPAPACIHLGAATQELAA